MLEIQYIKQYTRLTSQLMSLTVAINPSSGMGNQLFMMSAALGYAELHGGTVVFWEEPHSSWEHQGSAFRVRDMFPHIRILTEKERKEIPWIVIKQSHEASFTYNPLPSPPPHTHVKLEGYFQSDLYGPSSFPTIPLKSPLMATEFIAHDWRATFFLHVRRGDYLHPANTHYTVDLQDYWRKALRHYDPAKHTCFVVSDDMAWCQENLRRIVGSAWTGGWLWCEPHLSDVETFFWMTACEAGGICANSTFSWWAAWYIYQRVESSQPVLCMPETWGHPPLPPTRDLHPDWAKCV